MYLKIMEIFMSHTPHELAEEFPEQVNKIRKLKAENAHFTKIFDDYHNINRSIHRSETNVEPTDELTEQTMRKKRMALKDELWEMIKEG
jgi:uncharacterized protein YdcH (DUF465 family)